MPGPPKKPTALSLIQGNPGRRPLNKNEPKPPIARPAPPAFLGETACGEWQRLVDRLADIGLMTDIDVAALAAYCQAYARWVNAEEALARFAERDPVNHGLIIKTSNGNAIQSPLVGAANTAMQLMHKFAIEFGMTPAARTRLDVDIGNATPEAKQPGGGNNTGTDRFF